MSLPPTLPKASHKPGPSSGAARYHFVRPGQYPNDHRNNGNRAVDNGKVFLPRAKLHRIIATKPSQFIIFCPPCCLKRC